MKNIQHMTAAKKEGSLLFVSCVYKNMFSHYISAFTMQWIKIWKNILHYCVI